MLQAQVLLSASKQLPNTDGAYNSKFFQQFASQRCHAEDADEQNICKGACE